MDKNEFGARPYALGLYEKSMPNSLSIAQKLEVVRQTGFDHLELSIDETEEKLRRLDWPKETIEEILREQSRIGVPIRSICLSGHRKYPLGHPDESVRKRSLEIMEKAIRLACTLGIRIIQLAGYDVYYEPGTAQTREDFARNLQKCVDMAARSGVILAFETMETPFLNTVEKAMHWVREINSPYLQVYPDAGNITNAAHDGGTDVLDDLNTGAGHLAAVHLKETVPGVYREVPFGTGYVDFAAITRRAMELGVRLYLAEFWYVGQENWQQDIVESGRFLRAHLDRAARLL